MLQLELGWLLMPAAQKFSPVLQEVQRLQEIPTLPLLHRMPLPCAAQCWQQLPGVLPQLEVLEKLQAPLRRPLMLELQRPLMLEKLQVPLHLRMLENCREQLQLQAAQQRPLLQRPRLSLPLQHRLMVQQLGLVLQRQVLALDLRQSVVWYALWLKPWEMVLPPAVVAPLAQTRQGPQHQEQGGDETRS